MKKSMHNISVLYWDDLEITAYTPSLASVNFG